MITTLARAVAVVAVAASAAAAQQGAAPTTDSPAPSMFQPGRTYIGPRAWVGNLHGAVALGVHAERGITQPEEYGPGIVTGGLGVDFYSWSFTYPFGQYSYSVVPLQAFSNYHFIIPGAPKVDPYVGLALVYSIVNASWSGSGTAADAAASSIALAGQGGARYFLNERLALQAQIGFGYGTLGVGATWKF